MFIHLDEKWDICAEEIESIKSLGCKIVPNRVSCELDKWSLIQGTMELLKFAYSNTPKDKAHYYYLLSGQDYPIKSVKSLNEFLNKNYPKPFIDCTPYSENNWISYKFRTPIFSRILNIKHRIIRRPLLGMALLFKPLTKRFFLSKQFEKKNIGIYGGSAWWCLPDIVIAEIIQGMQDESLVRMLKKIRTPEEVVFQIMTMRSSLAREVTVNSIDRVSQNCLTYANFTTPTKKSTGHPHIILSEDLDWILPKSNYFARKFDMNVDANVFDLLDRHNEN